MLDVAEIKRGLALHLDPATLSAGGATVTCAKTLWAQGGHFFVCLGVTGDSSRWLPLYSTKADDRIEIKQTQRTGHPKWTQGSCYWHPAQVWTVANAIVVQAAVAGKDMSKTGARNTVVGTAVPDV